MRASTFHASTSQTADARSAARPPDAVEGSITCSDVSLADAEANAHVYVSAVADLYAVAASKVIVTFSSGRRRLQSGRKLSRVNS